MERLNLGDISEPSQCAVLFLNSPLEFQAPCWKQIWQEGKNRFATDGAANYLMPLCKNLSLKHPDFVIGDLDSINDETKAFFEKQKVEVCHDADQDTTDMTKLLNEVKNRKFTEKVDLVLVLGGLGGRFDHTLASINSLLLVEMEKPVLLLDSHNLLTVLRPGKHEIQLDKINEMLLESCGFVPISQEKTVVTTRGFHWDVTDQEMHFGGLISTSNQLEVAKNDGKLHIETTAPLLLMFHVDWKKFKISGDLAMEDTPPFPIPPMISGEQSGSEPPSKKMKGPRLLNIAVAGCSHGQMDKIYSTLNTMARNRNITIDLLICCGDYQAIRNSIRNCADLKTMHVNEKYRQLGTFHQYYSGEKVAPIFTIFVGGNHEASSFLAELPNGGWVAPNIYYMGFSSVVKFGGLRIGGLSGIYKPQDYNKGHYERPPYENGSMISAYHVRSCDIFRLKQMARRDNDKNLNGLDIMITHDWPAGITDFGNTEQLLRHKSHFNEDIRNNRLGNPATMDVLNMIKPRYWFSAHLHCHYEAQVEHPPISGTDKKPENTKFLALDKPMPNRKFLEILQIPVPEGVDDILFEYDPLWLAVLKTTDHLTEVTPRLLYMPSRTGAIQERWDFRPTEDEVKVVRNIFKDDFKIPDNFRQTAPPFSPDESIHEPCLYYRNPQTTELCEKLIIKNVNDMLFKMTHQMTGTPYYQVVKTNRIENSEEIDLGNDDDEEESDDNDFVLD
uniref:Thiamine diphosphokinase n=1 Tax=Panagrolaimus sp. JU765 TaxID=591449 RepID=A0AC34RC38_9BILA